MEQSPKSIQSELEDTTHAGPGISSRWSCTRVERIERRTCTAQKSNDPPTTTPTTPTTPMPDDQHSSDDGDFDLTVKLQNLRSRRDPWSHDIPSYLGKSSSTGLVNAAFVLRRELAAGGEGEPVIHANAWERPAVSMVTS